MNWKARYIRALLALLPAGAALVYGLIVLAPEQPRSPASPDAPDLKTPSNKRTAVANEPPPNPDTGWRLIRSADSLSFVIRRRSGVDHLLIYAGHNATGVEEIEQAAPIVLESGFDILTHRPRADLEEPELAAARAPLDAEQLEQFLELATARPGYRKRILILSGQHLRAGLAFLTRFPRSVAAIIVLRPGDAFADRRAIVDAALLLPEQLRIFWIPSNQGGEATAAARLRFLLERADAPPPIIPLNLPGLGAWRSGRPFELQLTETLVYELLQERLHLVWQDATKIFQGGCVYYTAAGRTRLFIKTTEVSAARDFDFCPLFVRRPGRPLFRVEDVAENRCTYRVADGLTRLYCAYE